jgi:hypothetical protein
MSTQTEPVKRLSLSVQDQEGIARTVHLAVMERDATGTLRILTPEGAVARELALTGLTKDKGGGKLTCDISGATATLALERDDRGPTLHVTASYFVTIVDATYHLSEAEHQRLLQWVDALAIGETA